MTAIVIAIAIAIIVLVIIIITINQKQRSITTRIIYEMEKLILAFSDDCMPLLKDFYMSHSLDIF